MTARRISPGPLEFPRLRTPLTVGEEAVFSILNEGLEPEWEIYVQPHMNGLRPDFVLLHPHNGICVLEVKDWDFESAFYEIDSRGEVRGRTSDGAAPMRVLRNPIRQVLAYKQAIRDLYCPRLQGALGLKCVSAGVVLARARKATGSALAEVLRLGRYADYPDQYPISTSEALEARDLSVIFPRHRRSFEEMSEAALKDLRHWLVEPEFSAEQRRAPEMSSEQRRLADSRTRTGYRRIKGAAGSGKSLVLAARAAKVRDEGKDVLVVTFNLTLVNYLRDLFHRLIGASRTEGTVTWLNFHRLCKWLASELDREDEYARLWAEAEGDRSEVLDRRLAMWTAEAIRTSPTEQVPRFDAILVDEGQDFRIEWWQALRALAQAHPSETPAELLLASDSTQDLYGTARSWTEGAMKGAGFDGDWSKMNVSYRMPGGFVPLVRSFAEEFLPRDDFTHLPEATQLEIFPFTAAWWQVPQGREVDYCVEALEKGLVESGDRDPLSFSDLVLIAGADKLGRAAVARLRGKGIDVESTFADEDEDEDDDEGAARDARERNRALRAKKLWFFKGDARVKATTIHSFKGWESRFVVALVDSSTTPASMYAALTRVKRSALGSTIVVVSSSTRFESAGRSWPQWVDHTGEAGAQPRRLVGASD